MTFGKGHCCKGSTTSWNNFSSQLTIWYKIKKESNRHQPCITTSDIYRFTVAWVPFLTDKNNQDEKDLIVSDSGTFVECVYTLVKSLK